MARITPQTARLLADELIKAGRARVNDRDSLIQSLLARSEATGDAAPETAIGAALMAAQPRTLTPAATAPMQPGVPFVAPKPTAEMLPAQMPAQMAAQMAAQPQPQELPVAPQRAARPSRYQPELDRVMANIAVAEQAMAGKQPNVTDRIRLGEMKRQAEMLGALARAEQSPEAEIPEEMRAAMEGRQARIARREELLAEQKARSPFAALLAAGAAGTQGRRGETDVEAITRILQAGFGGYDQSRRGFEEGTEKIAEARDQAMIDRYNMQEKASEAALQRARDILGMGRAAREEAVADVRLPTQLRGEEARTALAEFNLSDAPVEAASVRKLRDDQGWYYRNRPPPGAGEVDVEKRMATQALQGVADDYEGTRTLYNEEIREINADEKNKELTPEEKVKLVTPEVRNAYIKAKAILESRSRAYDRIYGSSPFIKGQGVGGSAPKKTARPPVPGATLAPDGKYYVKDPKKPGKWLLVE